MSASLYRKSKYNGKILPNVITPCIIVLPANLKLMEVYLSLNPSLCGGR